MASLEMSPTLVVGRWQQCTNMADVEEKSVEETVDSVEVSPKKKTKKRKREPEPGVIYLSRIPTGMNVKKIRQVFEDYGEIGRMFIQPDGKSSKNLHYRSKQCVLPTRMYRILRAYWQCPYI